ncbi:MAG: hypothetical protein QM726_22600 [Chitinophagaceae bacterium]
MHLRLLINVILLGSGFILSSLFLQAQKPANSSEDKVPAYALPDPLLGKDGKKIATAAEWQKIQRPYIYHLFEENVYGRFPTQKVTPTFYVRETNAHALNGEAVRKQVRIYLLGKNKNIFIDLLVYLPANAKKPVPVFVGYNFGGNQSIVADSGIFLTESWMSSRGGRVINNHATDSTRGTDTSQWQLRQVLAHGYGLAVAYYGDVEPDYADGWKTGIRTTMATALKIQPEEWGAIGAWAWGLGRIGDYLQQDPAIDANKIALIGHSRLGKAALWAAASDARFSVVISNESGEGGAALSKRFYGETVAIINQKFPWWFAEKYKTYGDNTDELPLDQHMLLSLMAPRPLYVASAEGDQWSDPKGEFLSAYNAGPVYALFNKKGIPTADMPGLHQPVGENIRYHIRAGRHDVTLYDWQQYLAFVDKYWK